MKEKIRLFRLPLPVNILIVFLILFFLHLKCGAALLSKRDPSMPQQVHLALTGKENEMSITWLTLYDSSMFWSSTNLIIDNIKLPSLSRVVLERLSKLLKLIYFPFASIKNPLSNNRTSRLPFQIELETLIILPQANFKTRIITISLK
ncbi:unnamed protein product [Meloidogyne enterolobii]|uniref:Uncharacterized protein n=1 Tax=Meloidogyne enterolobii TaxID=390850 RepID=A0ACB1B7Q8_MELEN